LKTNANADVKMQELWWSVSGVYISEDTKKGSKLNPNYRTSHVCSRAHKNYYSPDDYIDWSGPEAFW